MGDLEKRFFAQPLAPLVSSTNKDAEVVNRVLKRALGKGGFILRGGRRSKWLFNLDAIYS